METMTSPLGGPTPRGPCPLTPLPHGLLVQSLRAPGSGVNVEQPVCRLREPLDPERLAAAWAAVVGAMAHWTGAAAGTAEAAPATAVAA
jgi:hypothetical protein